MHKRLQCLRHSIQAEDALAHLIEAALVHDEGKEGPLMNTPSVKITRYEQLKKHQQAVEEEKALQAEIESALGGVDDVLQRAF